MKPFSFLCSLAALSIHIHTAFGQIETSVHRDDTLFIHQTTVLPVIDGSSADPCWSMVAPQPIDQPWITYGETVAPDDFQGSYKVLWSPAENLLYFYVEITDDMYVQGYRYNSDPKKGDFYYDYDMLEIFIDEDATGGMHVFDGEGDSAALWGTRSANAFAYHMILDEPADGIVARSVIACDLAGKSWNEYTIANYASHIRQFAMRKNGHRYIWEFALAIYSDTFDHSQQERSRVQLSKGKKMGISLAYCDNDGMNETPKSRDHFFGSVFVPKDSFNDHWKNADGFRRVVLTGVQQ